MKRWYAGREFREPHAVECDPSWYPHKDAEGRVQYENSHYDREEDAWAHLIADSEAGVSLTGMAVAQSRESLRMVEAEAATECVRFYALRHAFEAWKAQAEQIAPKGAKEA